MPTTSLLVFSGAALALLMIPGPAVLYILGRSAAQGRTAGLVSVAGIHVGTIVHVAAALVGLSAVIVASATAFTVVKLAGALYLILLGVTALRNKVQYSPVGGAPERRSLRRVFLDGVVLNVLNPKTALFFLAFVPQFVDPGLGSSTRQLLILSGLFIGLGLISDGAYAVAGGWLGKRLMGSARAQQRSHVVAGTTYIGLGLVTALSGGATSN